MFWRTKPKLNVGHISGLYELKEIRNEIGPTSSLLTKGELVYAKFRVPAGYSADSDTREEFQKCLTDVLSCISEQETRLDGNNELVIEYGKKEFTFSANPEEVIVHGEYSKKFEELLVEIGSKLADVSKKVRRGGRLGNVLFYSM